MTLLSFFDFSCFFKTGFGNAGTYKFIYERAAEDYRAYLRGVFGECPPGDERETYSDTRLRHKRGTEIFFDVRIRLADYRAESCAQHLTDYSEYYIYRADYTDRRQDFNIKTCARSDKEQHKYGGRDIIRNIHKLIDIRGEIRDYRAERHTQQQ